MELSISIVKLEARRMGEEAVLTVLLSAGEGREETVKLTVASKMLFEIGNIGANTLPYVLTREQYDTLEYDAELWSAVKKGLDLLAYADNTKSALALKLRQRGFDKYTAKDAAEYISDLGYIDEKRMLIREVERLANVKLYGKSRIKNELYRKGISREVIDENLAEVLSEIDFSENLCKLVRKKCDFDRLNEPKYRQSLYGAMYRYGYSPSETKEAIKICTEEDYE